MHSSLFFFLVLPLLLSHPSPALAIDLSFESSPLSTIAFGSCNRQFLQQSLWSHVASHDPDIFIWLGDSVYADIQFGPYFFPASADRLRTIYTHQQNSKEYSDFRSKVKRITGLWDDHDYGINNGNRDYSLKNVSKAEFLTFLEEPRESPRWEREGIYGGALFLSLHPLSLSLCQFPLISSLTHTIFPS